jgi:hypothetical protein
VGSTFFQCGERGGGAGECGRKFIHPAIILITRAAVCPALNHVPLSREQFYYQGKAHCTEYIYTVKIEVVLYTGKYSNVQQVAASGRTKNIKKKRRQPLMRIIKGE